MYLRRTRSPSVTAALFAALWLVATAAAPNSACAQDSEQRVVVIVNETPISAFDIAQRVRLIAVTTRQQPSEALKEKATEELISEAIQLQEAKKHGIVVANDQVNEALDTIASRNNMTRDKLVAALDQLGVHARTMRQKIQAQIAWQRIVRAKFRHQVSIAETQVDKALSDAPAENDGNAKAEFQLQRIRFALPDNPDQKTIAARLVQAEQLRRRITSCDQIGEAVDRFSRASVKNIGRKSAEDIPQPSRAILMAAKTGQLTPANITSTGVELYAVCGRRTVRSDDDQRKKVQAKLMGQEYEILALRYLRDLRQEAFVEYR